MPRHPQYSSPDPARSVEVIVRPPNVDFTVRMVIDGQLATQAERAETTIPESGGAMHIAGQRVGQYFINKRRR
jgi:hypothetical protein